MDFEALVQNGVQRGLSLKASIGEAIDKNPFAHEAYISRENSVNRRGLSIYNQRQFSKFADAVKYISLSEGLKLGSATRAAAERYPQLHKAFLDTLNKQGKK
jgi:hypothetical protein